MIEKKINSVLPVQWGNHTITLSSLRPNADGTLSGDIQAHGGYCINWDWLNPVVSIADGIEHTSVHCTAQEFLALVGAKLGKSPTDVLTAISGSLEDVYKAQSK